MPSNGSLNAGLLKIKYLREINLTNSSGNATPKKALIATNPILSPMEKWFSKYISIKIAGIMPNAPNKKQSIRYLIGSLSYLSFVNMYKIIAKLGAKAAASKSII
jgi:hypothetical protein